MKLIVIDRNVLSWADRGSLLAIQFGTVSISILHGVLPKWAINGVRFDLFTPARPKPGADYRPIGFFFRLFPSAPGAVRQWPKWRQYMFRYLSWRNYDCEGVLKIGRAIDSYSRRA